MRTFFFAVANLDILVRHVLSTTDPKNSRIERLPRLRRIRRLLRLAIPGASHRLRVFVCLAFRTRGEILCAISAPAGDG